MQLRITNPLTSYYGKNGFYKVQKRSVKYFKEEISQTRGYLIHKTIIRDETSLISKIRYKKVACQIQVFLLKCLRV